MGCAKSEKAAILLGAVGANVTTERTKGSKDQIKAQAPGIEITSEQTGEFAHPGPRVRRVPRRGGPSYAY